MPENRPTFSVVIPLYNKARHIKRALDSVLTQTFQDIEVVVVNDGSTDGSERIVEQYTDPRIRLVHREHINSWGGHAARNLGIGESHADLIAFLDADDEWFPDHLATIKRLSENYPECGAYATALEEVDEQHFRKRREYIGVPKPPWEGIIPHYFRTFRAKTSYPICCSTGVVSRRVFDAVGLFPAGERRCGDLDMWCRIALKYPIAFSTQVGATYHQDAENRMSIQIPHPPYCEAKFFATIEAALESGSLLSRRVRNDLVEYKNTLLLWSAGMRARRGNPAGARELLRKVAFTRRWRYQWFREWILSFVPESTQAVLRKLKRAVGR